MLSKQTLLMASHIALDVDENPSFPGIAKQVNPAIETLNTATHTAIPYTNTNAIDLIAENCGGNSEHHAITVEIADKVATGVRQGMSQIQQYLKPFAADLIQRLNTYDEGFRRDIIQDTFSNGSIRFVELDDPTLSMDVYPVNIENKAINYESVNAKEIDSVKNYMGPIDEATLKNIMATSNEEVNELLGYVDLAKTYDYVFRGDLSAILSPASFNVETQRYDFTKTYGANIRYILVGYLMCKRFVIDDEILKYVSGIGLAEIQAYFKKIGFCLESVLVRAKETFSSYEPRGLVVMGDTTRRAFNEDKIDIKGTLTLGVTSRAIDLLEEKGISASEIAMGHVLHQGERGNMPPMLEDSDFYMKAYRSVLDGYTSKNQKLAHEFVCKQVRAAIEKFQQLHPEFNDGVIRLATQNNNSSLVSELSGDIEFFAKDFSTYVAGQGGDVTNYVYNSLIVPKLGKVIGLTFAARILELATVSNTDGLDERGRRERLAEAVVQVIAEVYLNRFS